MADTDSTTALPSLAEPSYWRQSRGPLASLLFVLPLIVVYELGILVIGSTGIRNGADAWLRWLLDALGFSGYFLLPVLTVGILLAWHHTTHAPWRVRKGVLLGMLIESALLGVLLVGVAHVQGILFAPFLSPASSPDVELVMGGKLGETVGRIIGFFGAGFYEEVLFRLLLLPLVAALVRFAGGTVPQRAWVAVIVTSLVFSLAHYIGPYGDVLQLFTFTFRFLAGAFFAILFVYRGFGIAAGTHALYDIFVGLH